MNCAWKFCPKPHTGMIVIDRGEPRGPFCNGHALMLSQIKAEREAASGTHSQGANT